MTKQTNQADSSIHEDQLRNFLVNALTGAFGVSIAGDSSSDNDIRSRLRTKFDLDTVSAAGNTLLQEYTLEMLPEQVELVVDFHLRPYYGDPDETDGLYYSEAKRGTTAFHADHQVGNEETERAL